MVTDHGSPCALVPVRDGLFLRFKTGDGSIVCLPAPFRYRERNK
jgi:hypothetical protein